MTAGTRLLAPHDVKLFQQVFKLGSDARVVLIIELNGALLKPVTVDAQCVVNVFGVHRLYSR